MKGIGERIKQTRIARGWSQQELAEHIGSTRFLICRYENETVLPSAKMLAKIASALNLDLSYLTGGKTGSVTIDFYSDYPKRDVKGQVSPINIPENSNYFCIEADKDYACGISEGEILVLRPVDCAKNDFVAVVEYLSEEVLIGFVGANNGRIWLVQNATEPPIDITDEKEYKIAAEVVYAIKDFGRR